MFVPVYQNIWPGKRDKVQNVIREHISVNHTSKHVTKSVLSNGEKQLYELPMNI